LNLRHPHRDKLNAALRNPKCSADFDLLQEAMIAYDEWIAATSSLTTAGRERVGQMVSHLNEYKDFLEVDLIADRGSPFIRRQKGQLKLDNSVLEEFAIQLIHPKIISGLPNFELSIGPNTAFMSLSFMPASIESLSGPPAVVLKRKDQDFALGKVIHYQFSPDEGFNPSETSSGSFCLAVFAAEIKVNYDKTMFQECAGTAARLKQGCPIAKYYALVEYLDMTPEDCRLTEIDNVFLLRKAKRLPAGKRDDASEVRAAHKDNPIQADIIWSFVEEIQAFVQAVWYDPDAALKRGSFV